MHHPKLIVIMIKNRPQSTPWAKEISSRPASRSTTHPMLNSIASSINRALLKNAADVKTWITITLFLHSFVYTIKNTLPAVYTDALDNLIAVFALLDSSHRAIGSAKATSKTLIRVYCWHLTFSWCQIYGLLRVELCIEIGIFSGQRHMLCIIQQQEVNSRREFLQRCKLASRMLLPHVNWKTRIAINHYPVLTLPPVVSCCLQRSAIWVQWYWIGICAIQANTIHILELGFELRVFPAEVCTHKVCNGI